MTSSLPDIAQRLVHLGLWTAADPPGAAAMQSCLFTETAPAGSSLFTEVTPAGL